VNNCVITGLEPAKPKGWFELVVEGKPPFLVDAETVFRHSLKVGEPLSEQLLRKIRTEADIAWLKAKGIAILSRHMISERDLRRKLTEEGRPKAARDDVIYQLKHYGLIDDAKYAASFVRTQISRGPKSKLYLKSKLREKGVSDEDSSRAIESELAGIDEVSAIRALAEKKYQTVKYLPAQKARLKVINFLRGRGFSWDVIRKGISEIIPNDSTEQF
jgi:SOS response regulatory protein OraA/RecX